jgi:ribonuclease-3
LPEGELAKLRAAGVGAQALAEVASEIGLGEALVLGKGEDASGGRQKPSIQTCR